MTPATEGALKTVVIINTQARQADQVASEIAAACKALPQAGGDVYLVVPDKLADVIQQALSRGTSAFIIGGGDGTVRTAAILLAGKNVSLGIIPLGTTNNLARSLGLPLEWQAALEVIQSGHTSPLRFGIMNGELFCNAATLGISADIAQEARTSTKKLWGRLAYIVTGAHFFLEHRPFHCWISTDKETRHIETHELVVAHGSHHAGLPVAPDASLSKPELVVLAFGVHRSRWEHLKNLFLFAIGQHHTSRDALILRAPTVKIRTSPIQMIEADGEIAGKTPATFSVTEPRLHVFTPRA